MSKKHKHRKKQLMLLDVLPEPVESFIPVDDCDSPCHDQMLEEAVLLDDLLDQIDAQGRDAGSIPDPVQMKPATPPQNDPPQEAVQAPAQKAPEKKSRTVHEYEVARYIVDNYSTGLFQDIPYVKLDGVHVPLTDRLVGKLIDKSFEDCIKNGVSSNIWKSIFEWIHVLLDNAEHTLRIPERKILFLNGAYDFITGKKVYMTDTDFVPVRINARYDPKNVPETPVFTKFLDDCAAGDPQVKALILAFLGYMISPGSGKHLIVLGPAPDSGKSILGNFTRDLLGRKNTCAISMHRFTNAFEMAQLLGKSANYCLDVSGAVLNESTVATLKRLTGGDPETLNPKYKNPIQYENFAKIIFACNSGGIRLKTPDEGFRNRLVVIPFLKSVAPKDIDPDLPSKLWNERDGIVYYAVEALRKLYLNRYQFPYCRAGEALKAKWMQCPDATVQQFLNDSCVLSEEERIWTSELYDQYCAYCHNHDLQAVTERTFSHRIHSMPGTYADKWKSGNTQLRGVRGIGMKPFESL